MKVCYNNFWRSYEGVRLQCEFDIVAGVSAEDTKDSFFSKFYDIIFIMTSYTKGTRKNKKKVLKKSHGGQI